VARSAGCRQILAQAHGHIEEGRRRFDVSREERDEVAQRFLAAWEEGDVDTLVEVLAPDATPDARSPAR
jgi:RNA polymerase sigma-70 factor, ECF subfamily